jgi:hypothetical protein
MRQTATSLRCGRRGTSASLASSSRPPMLIFGTSYFLNPAQVGRSAPRRPEGWCRPASCRTSVVANSYGGQPRLKVHAYRCPCRFISFAERWILISQPFPPSRWDTKLDFLALDQMGQSRGQLNKVTRGISTHPVRRPCQLPTYPYNSRMRCDSTSRSPQ